MDPSKWSSNEYQLTQEFSRYALAIEVMIAGVTLPKKYLLKEWRSVLILLLPVMSTMWLISAAVFKFMFSLSFVHALAIGACVAPTDPVLANAILKGMFAESHVPLRLRNILTAESGANDGLGYPFLFFALYLMRLGGGKAIGTWFYSTWVYQVALSIVIGSVTGYVCRKALRHAETAGWVDKESFLSSSITLALLLVGVCTIVGTDDILCCFVAGNSFTWDDWFRVETEDTGLQETMNGLVSMSFFIYFGTIIPWPLYTGILSPWRMCLAVILVMILRRLPVIMASYKLIPAIRTWQDALFAGWFGPIGVSAVFYSIETIKQLNMYENSNSGRVASLVYPIVCAVVFGSVLVHGVTIPLVLMGKRVKTTLSISASSIWNNGNKQQQQPSRMSFRNLSAWYSEKRQRSRRQQQPSQQAPARNETVSLPADLSPAYLGRDHIESQDNTVAHTPVKAKRQSRYPPNDISFSEFSLPPAAAAATSTSSDPISSSRPVDTSTTDESEEGALFINARHNISSGHIIILDSNNPPEEPTINA